MGRHRRTASTSTTADRTAAADRSGNGGAHRHRRRGPGYVRTGLLGASAAVAVGAIAVTSGVLPGSGSYSIGGGEGSDQVRSIDTPSGLETLGGSDGPASGATHPDGDHSTGAQKPSASGAPGSDGTAGSSGQPGQKRHAPHATATAGPTASRSTAPQAPSTKPGTPTPKPSKSAEYTAAQQVLALVNQERDKAGCSPLRSDSNLAKLADAFSEQMADEDFFDHTDPAGLSPWDRAAKAGITNLGGENIARGQTDAAAVMDSWMNSAGHRANILNCDYRTIGIGVHFGAGGPWWTQDFGF